jgi:hypothetical protein
MGPGIRRCDKPACGSAALPVGRLAARSLSILLQVCLKTSRLCLPVSLGDCAISRRTVMNTARWASAERGQATSARTSGSTHSAPQLIKVNIVTRKPKAVSMSDGSPPHHEHHGWASGEGESASDRSPRASGPAPIFQNRVACPVFYLRTQKCSGRTSNGTPPTTAVRTTEAQLRGQTPLFSPRGVTVPSTLIGCRGPRGGVARHPPVCCQSHEPARGERVSHRR